MESENVLIHIQLENPQDSIWMGWQLQEIQDKTVHLPQPFTPFLNQKSQILKDCVGEKSIFTIVLMQKYTHFFVLTRQPETIQYMNTNCTNCDWEWLQVGEPVINTKPWD